ncbi:MAG: sortase [Chloroflexi bacterium]|nr:sortase [Chloroflexota bacterium]
MSKHKSRVTIIKVLITVFAWVLVVILTIANLTLGAEIANERRHQPTPTAEMTHRHAVLPGSSQPPPGEGEIPPQFRPYLMPSTLVSLLPPTSDSHQAVRLVIKMIGIDVPVWEGDDWHTLKRGVGHTPGTANPGETGNCVISGHDDVYGEVFRYLSDLEPGNEVLVYNNGGRGYKYKVYLKFLVPPNAVEVLDPTTTPVLTLITSYPYLIDSHRLIVVCKLQAMPRN